MTKKIKKSEMRKISVWCDATWPKNGQLCNIDTGYYQGLATFNSVHVNGSIYSNVWFFQNFWCNFYPIHPDDKWEPANLAESPREIGEIVHIYDKNSIKTDGEG